ncbi:hypothetical protein Agub_g4824, partial [Astrephomene gubernaculifera]
MLFRQVNAKGSVIARSNKLTFFGNQRRALHTSAATGHQAHPPAMPLHKIEDPEAADKTRREACPHISLLPVRHTKTIHFIRHGQGFHNVAGHINHDNYKLWDYVDAHLTELGWRQAEALGRHIRSSRVPVELVVVAPLQRALETAVGAFGNHGQQGEGQQQG